MSDPSPPYPWTGHAIMSSARAETTIPLDPTRCLLLRPVGGPVTVPGVPTQAVDAADVMAINLRTYGFASQYLFAETQDAATAVRREAKTRPRAVEWPRPFRQVMLIDADPGDHRLAAEHLRRGWPERLMVDGHAHDYVVLDSGDRPVERCVDLSALGKERAMRRLGTADVRETTVALDPRQLAAAPRP